MDEMVPVKLLLTYNVLPETIQEYWQFVMGRYVPTMQAMGLQMFDAYQTTYGDAPDRLVLFVAANKETALRALRTETWDTLNDQLLEFVTDFDYKLVPFREKFQF
jgi:hypothetical protein